MSWVHQGFWTRSEHVGRQAHATLATLIAPAAAYTAALTFVVAVAATANAQALRSVDGTVVDESGGAIAGARVSVSNASGSIAQVATADETGAFSIASLPLGRYTFQVESPLFETTRQNIQLDAGGDPLVVRIVLAVGRLVESVAVTAPRATTGALGNRPVIDSPFSINVIPQSLITNQQAQLLLEVLRNDPSAVAGFGAGYSSFQSISLRGLAVSSAANYRRNGLPFNYYSDMSFESVDRVEVLKGLSGFLYGFATPGGILNIVPKKPTNQRYASVRTGVTSGSLFLMHGDFGDRVGQDDQVGYRINVAREQGNTAINRVDLGRTLASASVDWKVTSSAVLTLDIEKHKVNPTGQPLYYQLAAGVPVPHAPRLSAFNGIPHATYTTDSTLVGVRADWAINTGWAANTSVMDQRFDRDAWFSFGTIVNANGDMNVTILRDAVQAFPSRSAQASVTGKFASGTLKHEVSAGVNWNTNQWFGGDFSTANYTSNLLVPVEAPATNIVSVRNKYEKSNYEERGVFVADTVSIGRQVQLIGGLRYANLDQRNFSFTNTQIAVYEKGALSPSGAVVVKPQPNLAVYGSFAEGLEQGGVAQPVHANAGEIFGPLKSRQLETGVKWDITRAFGLTGAVFDIRKGLTYTDPTTNRFVQDGRQTHTGIEVTAGGQVVPNVNIVAGFMALDASAARTGNALLDGKRPVNVPKYTASLFADYSMTALPGVGVNAGYQYVGSRQADVTNTRSIEAYGLLNIGVRYETRLMATRAILRANVDNVTNTDYWAAATPTLHAGLPRTFKSLLQFEF